MSQQNVEERIARLEATVLELSRCLELTNKTQRDFCQAIQQIGQSFVAGNLIDSLLAEQILNVEDSGTALARFVAENPRVVDAQSRQPILDVIAKLEMVSDNTRALIQSIRKTPPGEIPPTPPPAPGT